jgi:hypothetical protein
MSFTPPDEIVIARGAARISVSILKMQVGAPPEVLRSAQDVVVTPLERRRAA